MSEYTNKLPRPDISRNSRSLTSGNNDEGIIAYAHIDGLEVYAYHDSNRAIDAVMIPWGDILRARTAAINAKRKK